MFNYASRKWDARTADESVHVPVVPLEGRVGIVRSAPAMPPRLSTCWPFSRARNGVPVSRVRRRTRLSFAARNWPKWPAGLRRRPIGPPPGNMARSSATACPARSGSTACGSPARTSITRHWTQRLGRPPAATPRRPGPGRRRRGLAENHRRTRPRRSKSRLPQKPGAGAVTISGPTPNAASYPPAN